MTSIRSATLADGPAIAVLLHQLGYPVNRETVHGRLLDMCEGSDSAVLVAEDGHGRLMGCAHVLIDRRLAEGRRGEITSIAVDERLRSRGTGSLLVRAAAAWLQSRNIERLRIRCNARRQRAHRFYEQLGFQLTKQQKVFDIAIDAMVNLPTAG